MYKGMDKNYFWLKEVYFVCESHDDDYNHIFFPEHYIWESS